jgi:predicted NBD/HSP70 family sugar kinase
VDAEEFVNIDPVQLLDNFKAGFRDFESLCQEVLPSRIFTLLQRMSQSEVGIEGLNFSARMWADAVFAFLLAYSRADYNRREELSNAFTYLIVIRIAAFAKSVKGKKFSTVRQLLNRQSQYFVEAKEKFIIQRMRDSVSNLSRALRLDERHTVFTGLSNVGDRKDLISIRLTMRQVNGDVVTENVAVPRKLFELAYEKLVEYLAARVAIRGEVLGVTRVGISINGMGLPMLQSRLVSDVREEFEEAFGSANIHANFGRAIQWGQGQTRTGSIIEPASTSQAAVNYNSGLALGVDIGGTFIKVAVVRDGRIAYWNSLPLVGETRSIGELVREQLETLAVQIGITPKQLKQMPVCIAVPGLVTPEGEILDLPNLERSHTGTINSLNDLRRLYPLIRYENDANIAAFYQSVRRNVDRPLILNTLGTGLGLGIVMAGQVLNAPLEVHIKYDFSEEAEVENCGLKGCIQLYTTASGVVKRAIGLARERNVCLPRTLREKIERTPPQELGMLAYDFGQLLGSRRSDLRRLAEDVFREFGNILMIQYAEIARIMDIREF